MLQTVIRSFHPKPGQRILVTSDVYGCGNWLQALLVQLAFSADDVLVIIGDLIEKGPRRSLVRHVATGRELWVRNSWLRYRDGQWSVKDDYTDYKIGVQPGDVVSVVLQQDGDWLIKKDGIAGWYTGDLELV